MAGIISNMSENSSNEFTISLKKLRKTSPQTIGYAGLLFSQPVVVRYTHIIYRLLKK